MVKKKVCIEDVARLAGVSITTVSRVINKVPTVNPLNRKKTEEAIKRLKYRPSVIARALAKGSSNAVGLVIPRYEGIFYSFYAIEILRGIGTLCEALKLDLLLHLTDGRTFLNTASVGGVIFADIITNQLQLKEVLEEEIPCVVINNFIDDLQVDCFAIDNLNGAKEAVRYLIELGHRRVAHITGDLITQAASLRLEGYKLALKDKGISINPDYIIKTDYSRGEARQAALTLLSLTSVPTAIFVASDAMALEVIAVIMEKGLRVPDNISVIGFDDNPSGLYGPVSLTTVRQPLVHMAQEAVKELSLLMSGKKRPIKKVHLPTELIVRESCKAIT